MKIFVGTYRLGLRNVKLYASLDDGGQVRLFPKKRGVPEVYVGIGESWTDALTTLLHEAYELALIDLRTRYEHAPGGSEETSDFIFLMTHNELGKAHEVVADFIIDASHDLGMIYNREKKKREKERKKNEKSLAHK